MLNDPASVRKRRSLKQQWLLVMSTKPTPPLAPETRPAFLGREAHEGPGLAIRAAPARGLRPRARARAHGSYRRRVERGRGGEREGYNREAKQGNIQVGPCSTSERVYRRCEIYQHDTGKPLDTCGGSTACESFPCQSSAYLVKLIRSHIRPSLTTFGENGPG